MTWFFYCYLPFILKHLGNIMDVPVKLKFYLSVYIQNAKLIF